MKENSLKPYLSIIVPIYNTEKYLRKCIDSILDQTYKDYELILVDDGSTDSSPSICDYYVEHDKRIQVIHKENGGVTSARKAGLMASCGEYISFVDSDDWMEPDFYSIFIDCCQSTRADIIVASGYQNEEARRRKIQRQRAYIKLQHGIYSQGEVKQILENDKIRPPLWLKLFQRELISENIWLIDNRVCLGEDMLCSYACMLDADSIAICCNCLYHYVQRETSAVHKHSEKNIKSVYYFADNLKKIRHIKNAYFLDERWNQVILTQLLNAIFPEFREQKLLLSKRKLKEVKRKFKGIELSRLLIGGKYKTVVGNRKRKERVIFLLYSLRCYRLLNFYMKIYKV